MAEDDIFQLIIKFISDKLPKIAKPNDRFLSLISKLVRKLERDHALRMLLGSFIKTGSNDPKLGFELFEMIKENGSDDLRLYSGYFLGGAASAGGHETFFQKMEMEYEGSDPQLKAAFILAVGVLRIERKDISIPSRILDIVIQAIDDQCAVKRAAIETCIKCFDLDPKKFGDLLLRVTKFGTLEDKIILLQYLGDPSFALPDEKLESEILDICSQEENENVLRKVASALRLKAERNPEKALEILKLWIINCKYFKIAHFFSFPNSLTKSDLEKCFSKIESWIQEDIDPNLLYKIPCLLWSIFSRNPIELIKLLDRWRDKEEVFTFVILRVLRYVLAVYEKNGGDKVEHNDEILDLCFSLLSSITERKGLDKDQIIKSEESKILQCLKLINELEETKKELNYHKIDENLRHYESISNFLNKEIKELRDSENKTHPLLICLSIATTELKENERQITEPDNENHRIESKFIHRQKIYATAFLTHLNYMLSLFEVNGPGSRHIRNTLKNEEQFWSTVSELEIATSFMKMKYDVTMEPEIHGKRLDVHVKTDDNDIYFEVMSPEMCKFLRYLKGIAIVIKNRAIYKIKDKLQKQLKNLYGVLNSPLILVIDISRSEISYEDFSPIFEDSSVFRMKLEGQTSQFIDIRYDIMDDGLPREISEFEIISAVVAYERNVTKDGKVSLNGEIFLNPMASHPLNDNLKNIIEKSIFGSPANE